MSDATFLAGGGHPNPIASRGIPITAVLRLAESVPETPENYPIIRELIHALKDLVELANKAKDAS